MMRLLLLFVCGAVCTAAGPQAPAAEPPVRVLIVDGLSNHDWKLTTTLIRGILEPTGLFTVTVSTAPPTRDSAEWATWRPRLRRLRRRHPDLQQSRRRRALAAWRRGGLRDVRSQRRWGLRLARRKQRLPRLARLQPDDRPGLAQEGLRLGSGRGRRRGHHAHPGRRRSRHGPWRPPRHPRPPARRSPHPRRAAACVDDTGHRGLLLRPWARGRRRGPVVWFRSAHQNELAAGVDRDATARAACTRPRSGTCGRATHSLRGCGAPACRPWSCALCNGSPDDRSPHRFPQISRLPTACRCAPRSRSPPCGDRE